MRRKWKHDDVQSQPVSEMEQARHSQLRGGQPPMRTRVRIGRVCVSEDGDVDVPDRYSLGWDSLLPSS
jgi:hypothetical protein